MKLHLKEVLCGRLTKVTEQEDMELTSPHEHIKNNLHVEQFSLKTNWKLAEGLLYNQDFKKDTK